MPSSQSIINSLNQILRITQPAARTVTKRVITRENGDPLLGRKGSVTYVDTVVTPQPYFMRLGRDYLHGEHDRSYTVVDSANQEIVADDYKFIFSPTSITRQEFQNPDMVLTLTDGEGNVETLTLLDITAPTIGSTEVAFIAYYRSAGEKPA
jgi:hypothetical protein